MSLSVQKGRPVQPWADVPSDALMWHDKARHEWVGHSVKFESDAGEEQYRIVDRVEDRGGGVWRLYFIPPA